MYVMEVQLAKLQRKFRKWALEEKEDESGMKVRERGESTKGMHPGKHMLLPCCLLSQEGA